MCETIVGAGDIEHQEAVFEVGAGEDEAKLVRRLNLKTGETWHALRTHDGPWIRDAETTASATERLVRGFKAAKKLRAKRPARPRAKSRR